MPKGYLDDAVRLTGQGNLQGMDIPHPHATWTIIRSKRVIHFLQVILRCDEHRYMMRAWRGDHR